ncbi:uncharacterized protein LOC135435748 [Drosophila montana]|uniref:uncharacterized protein LOC135435748 n=1 Tax=Drosophila montana TaxID=40370 RepID=UPI00313EC72E
MKFVAFLLLSSLTVALVVAFPDNHNAVADLPDADLHADAVSTTEEGGAATPSETNQLRRPRHLLKKLFYPEPQVIVQPILVQPRPYYTNPYIGAGRGYNIGYGIGKSYKKW